MNQDLKYSKLLLKVIDSSVGLDTVNNYIDEVSSREFVEMKSMEQVNSYFDTTISKFLDSLSYDEILELKNYTGYNFKFINAYLRKNWNYEEHGILDEDKQMQFHNTSYNISKILNKFDTPDVDFMCFRGTRIDAFHGYGIYDLQQLKNLEGQFMFERGFSSTSILRESCYFNNNQIPQEYNCNICIRYLIPSESNDGVLLSNEFLSYAPNQNEFLLDAGTLTKVMNVQIDEVNNLAILTVLLIPKSIYDLTYNKNRKL